MSKFRVKLRALAYVTKTVEVEAKGKKKAESAAIASPMMSTNPDPNLWTIASVKRDSVQVTEVSPIKPDNDVPF